MNTSSTPTQGEPFLPEPAKQPPIVGDQTNQDGGPTQQMGKGIIWGDAPRPIEDPKENPSLLNAVTWGLRKAIHFDSAPTPSEPSSPMTDKPVQEEEDSISSLVMPIQANALNLLAPSFIEPTPGQQDAIAPLQLSEIAPQIPGDHQMAATISYNCRPLPTSTGLPTPIAPVQYGEVINATSPKISPYTVAQRLLREINIKIINNAFYYFNGHIFTLLGKDALKRLIVDRCRIEVAAIGNPRFIEQVYEYLRYEPEICDDNLTPSQDEVVFKDGVLNLQTGIFGPPYPGFFATTYLNASYFKGQETRCPTFDKFVADITGGDNLLAQRIWEVLGYCLTQDQRGKCFFLLQGPHDSGKSVLGNFLRGCYNKEMVSSLDIQSLGRQFALADLIGKGLCIDLDLPAGSINERAVSILKKLTGGDQITTDIKYMSAVSFINVAKFFFATNHSVLPRTADKAFLSRLVLIPFLRSIPVELQDRSLGDRLAAERDGIIMKALWYYRSLRDRNYQFAGDFSPNSAVSGYDDAMDSLVRFLRDKYRAAPSGWVSSQTLYNDFASMYGFRWPLNTFSEHVNSIITILFPSARRGRGRTSSSANPIGGYYGIAPINISLPGTDLPEVDR